MKNLDNSSERELNFKLTQGDESSFEQVFNRFHKKIFAFSFNILKNKEKSEEIVQDTFLNLWQKRESIDPDRDLQSYIFTITRRLLIDAWRKESKSASYKSYIKTLLISEQSDETEQLIYFNELQRVLNEVIENLSPQQRNVFTLSRYEKLNYDEIAERLNISRNTVKYHLVNVLNLLRTHLKKHGELYFFILGSFLLQ